MKRLSITALAALALAATIPTSAFAADPVSPQPGALCNLYPAQNVNDVDSLSQKPAAATFIDTESTFKASGRKENLSTEVGLWTGWMKLDRAGTYTFVTKTFGGWYKILINGRECVSANGQEVFNVELDAGFNSIIVVYRGGYNLVVNYRRAGSLKESVSFGPKDMFYDSDAVEED